jgi:class 3 adenylate cyclase
MELLADRDPEEARKLLDPVLEIMMEAVHRFEGTVNQVMGDGIMALFGAPLAHEDHAVRASYAALRMQQSVKKYAEEVRRSHAAVIKIRVGLNSGIVMPERLHLEAVYMAAPVSFREYVRFPLAPRAPSIHGTNGECRLAALMTVIE